MYSSDFIAQAEQRGLRNVPQNPAVQQVYDLLLAAHRESFQLAFLVSAGLAVVGAVCSWVLVRWDQRTVFGPVFGRRSRWIRATPGGVGEGVTRLPGTGEPDGPAS